MTKVGVLLGGDNTTREQMKNVMDFESRLARVMTNLSLYLEGLVLIETVCCIVGKVKH